MISDDGTLGPGYKHGALTVHEEAAPLSRVTQALRSSGRTVTLVPTMGALHAGHAELIRRARLVPNSVTVVSIFVNPMQFGPGEDLERYPRNRERDLDICREEGVELVFAPTAEEIYGATGRSDITVNPGPLGDELEGASRPGHFAGVLTVVAKLLGIIRPNLALFGEKDYQQLVLVRRMARQLNLGADLATSIQGIPIVRDADGLALSSRNRYLTDEQRQAALALSAALAAGVYAGPRGAEAALSAAREVLTSGDPGAGAGDGLELDYLELRNPELGPAPDSGEARLLVAARLGETRLIDNAAVELGATA